MTDLTALYQAIDERIEANFAAETEALAALLKIPSKRADPQPGAPYGPACAQALDTALELGRSLGFSAVDLDHYIGYLETGSGPELLGVLAHLDVVPEGEGWIHPPYGAVIEDGVIWGRGTQDDKGPAIAALYAMLALKEAGVIFDRRVRLILGCDEESGSSDLVHYCAHAETPGMIFSPDADYPVVNGEKGILRAALSCALPQEGLLPRVVSLAAGERVNIVVSSARARVEGLSAAEIRPAAAAAEAATGVTFVLKEEAGGLAIEALGTGAHGASPHKGNNAATALIGLLAVLPLQQKQAAVFSELARLLPHGDWEGKALGIACSEPILGGLTCNLGLLSSGGGKLSAVLDIRYPLGHTGEDLVARMKKAAVLFDAQVVTDVAPHYVPADHPLVQKLLEAYTEITGKEGRCLSIGGGTYAHDFACGVAFGCMFEDQEDLMHQPNERLPLELLKLNTRILARAIFKLSAKA